MLTSLIRFQEFTLLPRCLVFTDDRVYLVCCKSVWIENTIYEKFPAKTNEVVVLSKNVARPRDTDGDPYGTYILLFMRYGQRKLTDESDALNAMTGIINRLCI
jgi:hypothetical protein